MHFDHLRQITRSVRFALIGVAVIAVASACASGASGSGGAPPPSGWLAAGCYDNPTPGQPDLTFTGTENVVGNTVIAGTLPATPSVNGTCSGPNVISTGTVVRAATTPAATTLCQSLIPGATGAASLSSIGYAVPADAWLCVT